MTRIIERVEAHYEVHEVEMGTLYRWCPQSVVLQCTCGAKPTLTTSKEVTCTGCARAGAPTGVERTGRGS